MGNERPSLVSSNYEILLGRVSRILCLVNKEIFLIRQSVNPVFYVLRIPTLNIVLKGYSWRGYWYYSGWALLASYHLLVPGETPRIYSRFKNHWFFGLSRETCIRLTLPMNASLKHGFKTTSFKICMTKIQQRREGHWGVVYTSSRYLQDFPCCEERTSVYAARYLGEFHWAMEAKTGVQKGQRAGIWGVMIREREIIDVSLKFSINFSSKYLPNAKPLMQWIKCWKIKQAENSPCRLKI